jgi:hypothetical protein
MARPYRTTRRPASESEARCNLPSRYIPKCHHMGPIETFLNLYQPNRSMNVVGWPLGEATGLVTEVTVLPSTSAVAAL